MRIVYYGPLSAGSTSLHRMRAMTRLGHTVFPVDSTAAKANPWFRTLDRLNWVIQKLYTHDVVSIGMVDASRANTRLRDCARVPRIHVVWLDKALDIKPGTFAAIRAGHPDALIVGYSPDDMTRRINRSRYFSDTIHLYDAYFTTKSYGVAELLALGCPRVFFVGNGYDPETHSPIAVTDRERDLYGAPVGFIGTHEDRRATSLMRLCRAGIPVRVWGDGWDRLRGRVSNLRIEGRAVYQQEFAKVVAATKINLCFLRKANRDQQTTRSIELPACGGFMMAERTDEHRDLFAEGREAAFFGDDQELIAQCRYYLAHDEERERIARAGLARCGAGGYGNDARMADMLGHLAGLSSRGGDRAVPSRSRARETAE